jgi:hypothetical protein
MTRHRAVAFLSVFILVLTSIVNSMSPIVASATDVSKNPWKVADGYDGKFDPTGTKVAYLNVHDGLLHVVDSDGNVDVNTGIRPYGHHGASARTYLWDCGALRVVTSDLRIVRTGLDFKPKTSVALKGAGELRSNEYGDAALNPIEDSVCGLLGGVEGRYYWIDYTDLKQYTVDKEPIDIVDVPGNLHLWGWNPEGTRVLYSHRTGTNTVDKDGTNNTELVDWPWPFVDWTSGMMLCYNSSIKKYFVQDMDNKTNMRILNDSPSYGYGFPCQRDGCSYAFDWHTGITSLNLTTQGFSYRWPYTFYALIGAGVSVHDICGSRALLSCGRYGLFITDMDRAMNVSSRDFKSFGVTYWENAHVVAPESHSYLNVSLLQSVLLASVMAGWLLVRRKSRRRSR